MDVKLDQILIKSICTAISPPSDPLLAPNTYHSDCTLSIPDFPPFEPLDDPSFTWGSCDGESCVLAINECYSTAVHWKPNLFRIPSGNVGEAFIQKLSRLFRAYGSSSALESVALTAALLMPMLLLQHPSKNANCKTLISHLDRRLTLWKDGLFFNLLHEGESL